MNEQLAKTLGITFVKKGRTNFSDDVKISKSADGRRYTFSFSKAYGKKLGGYVRIAKAKNRLYIAPGCRDDYGYKLTGNRWNRKHILVTAATIGFIDEFLGGHTIKYFEDLDAYYITAKEEE